MKTAKASVSPMEGLGEPDELKYLAQQAGGEEHEGDHGGDADRGPGTVYQSLPGEPAVDDGHDQA
jgi:hypothetical protein